MVGQTDQNREHEVQIAEFVVARTKVGRVALRELFALDAVAHIDKEKQQRMGLIGL